MPQAVPVVMALTTQATAGAILLSLAMSAISASMVKGQEKKPRRDITQNITSNVESRKIVYGETVISGPYVMIEASTENTFTGKYKDFLNRIVVLTGHPIESFEQVYLDDDKVDMSDLDTVVWRGNSKAWRIKDNDVIVIGVTQNETGAPDSAEAIALRRFAGTNWVTEADPNTPWKITSTEAANSSRKLNECAYIYNRLRLTDEWSGIPNIKAHIKGKRVRSIQKMIERRDVHGETNKQILQNVTPEYSNNLARCILDYMMDEKLGLGIPLSEIDLDNFYEMELLSDGVIGEAAQDPLTNQTFTYFDDSANSKHLYTYRIPGVNPDDLATYLSKNSVTINFGTDDLVLTDFPRDNGYSVHAARDFSQLKYKGSFNATGTFASNYTQGSIDYSTGEISITTSVALSAPNTNTINISFGDSLVNYTCDGIIDCSETPVTIMEALLSAGVGSLVYTQGKYRLFLARAEVPHAEPITEDDLAGPVTIRVSLPRNERFNAVRGTYINKDQDFVTADFSEVRNPIYKEADKGEDDYLNAEVNGYSYMDVDFPFTIYKRTAERLAKIILDKSRQSLVVEGTFKPKCIRYSVGDNVLVNFPTLLGSDPATELKPGFVAATIGTVSVGGGSVTSIAVADGGAGYIHPPVVNIGTVGSSSGAGAIAVLEGGSVKEIIVTDPGTGYTGAPAVTLENFSPGWTDKEFKVTAWSNNEDGSISMTLVEDAPAIYTFAGTVTRDFSPDLDLYTNRVNLAPQNLRLTTGVGVSYLNESGNYSAAIKADWTAAASANEIDYYELQVDNGIQYRFKIGDLSVGTSSDPLEGEQFRRSTATFNLAPGESFATFPEYNIQYTLNGPITSWFPGYSYNSYTAGHEDLVGSEGSNITTASFDGSWHTGTAVSIPDGDVLYSENADTIVDFTSDSRDYSLELDFSLPSLINRRLLTVGDGQASNSLIIETTNSSTGWEVKYGTTTVLSGNYTFATNTPYQMFFTSRGTAASGGCYQSLYINNVLEAESYTAYAITENPATHIMIAGEVDLRFPLDWTENLYSTPVNYNYNVLSNTTDGTGEVIYARNQRLGERFANDPFRIKGFSGGASASLNNDSVACSSKLLRRCQKGGKYVAKLEILNYDTLIAFIFATAQNRSNTSYNLQNARSITYQMGGSYYDKGTYVSSGSANDPWAAVTNIYMFVDFDNDLITLNLDGNNLQTSLDISTLSGFSTITAVCGSDTTADLRMDYDPSLSGVTTPAGTSAGDWTGWGDWAEWQTKYDFVPITNNISAWSVTNVLGVSSLAQGSDGSIVFTGRLNGPDYVLPTSGAWTYVVQETHEAKTDDWIDVFLSINGVDGSTSELRTDIYTINSFYGTGWTGRDFTGTAGQTVRLELEANNHTGTKSIANCYFIRAK